MSLLLLFKNPEVVIVTPSDTQGPDTTFSWRHLLREAKVELNQEDNAGMVSLDRMRQRIASG